MNSAFNIIEVIKIALRWKRQIIIASVLAIIGSVIIALLLPNYYQSTAIIYPSSPALLDRQNLFSTQASDVPIDYFGTEHDADRLLSIAKASPMAAYIIYKYNLKGHYKIDTNGKYPEYEVNREFKDNFKAIKNEYSAIEITIIDTDKDLAAQIVNDIVAKIDQENKQLILSNKIKTLEVLEGSLKKMSAEINTLTDSIIFLRQKYRLIQQRAFSLKAIMAIEKITTLEKKKENALDEYNKRSNLYEQYNVITNSNASSIYIVEDAYPSEKKVKPVRWLIVVSSFLITFFLSVLAAVLIEKAKAVAGGSGRKQE